MIGLALRPHDGAPLAPHDLWTAWSWEPGVLLGLGVAAALYAGGMTRLRARAGDRTRARRREAVSFWAGWVLLAVALVSPLHRLGEALLSAHMTQHELLMVVAAPLLVLGRPFVVSLWGLPVGWRPVLGRWTGRFRPMWRAVLALLFWWSVLPGASLRGRHGAASLSLFSTMVYTGGLGALLTLGRPLWYPAYGAVAALGPDAAGGPAARRAHHVGAGWRRVSARHAVARRGVAPGYRKRGS
ncbi:hypothetical protein BH24GEM1_BH24GEM1_18150 [soil metagenome]